MLREPFDRSPLIALTPWRRTLATWVHPANDLYTIDPEYPDSVTAAGGIAAIIPWVSTDEQAGRVMERFDALMLTGGDDVDPELYEQAPDGAQSWDCRADLSDSALLRAALDQDKPVLAICRGLQISNVALGGTLHQHMLGESKPHQPRLESGDTVADADEHLARRHSVSLTAGSLVAKVFGGASEISAGSLHHQSAGVLGNGCVVTGTADDGVVEAMEHESGMLLAVQWHPERITTEGHHVLFDWLVDAARQPNTVT